MLEVDQPSQVLTGSKSGKLLRLMLINTAFQVVRDADIKDTGIVGHDVSVVIFHPKEVPASYSTRQIPRFALNDTPLGCF